MPPATAARPTCSTSRRRSRRVGGWSSSTCSPRIRDVTVRAVAAPPPGFGIGRASAPWCGHNDAVTVVVEPALPPGTTTREPAVARTTRSVDGPPPRLRSLDVLRGLAIAAMLLVDNPGVPGAHPRQLVHSPWNGLRFADVVFPVFLVAVGVAMPFSRRAAAPRLVVRRVVALVGLSMVLHALKYGNPAPTGVLEHIAGSYAVAWLVLRLRPRAQIVAVAVLLAGAWAAYTWVTGGGIVAGSWAPGSTPGAYLDRLVYGAPQTEGVVPMILGAVDVVAGAVVGRALRRRETPAARRRVLAAVAAAGTIAGLLLAVAIPLNK